MQIGGTHGRPSDTRGIPHSMSESRVDERMNAVADMKLGHTQKASF